MWMTLSRSCCRHGYRGGYLSGPFQSHCRMGPCAPRNPRGVGQGRLCDPVTRAARRVSIRPGGIRRKRSNTAGQGQPYGRPAGQLTGRSQRRRRRAWMPRLVQGGRQSGAACSTCANRAQAGSKGPAVGPQGSRWPSTRAGNITASTTVHQQVFAGHDVGHQRGARPHGYSVAAIRGGVRIRSGDGIAWPAESCRVRQQCELPGRPSRRCLTAISPRPIALTATESARRFLLRERVSSWKTGQADLNLDRFECRSSGNSEARAMSYVIRRKPTSSVLEMAATSWLQRP